MDNRNKLVSIGLPVYNGAGRIQRILDSLLAQTYQNFELIVSDDASTDETDKICQEYARKDKRIRYIRQDKNTGQLKNEMYVLRAARGEYVALVGDDDWWDPEFISFLAPILDNHPDYGVAIGSVKRIYDDGTDCDTVVYSGDLDITNLSYSEVFKRMIGGEPIHWFAGLFRTKLLQELLEIPFSTTCRAADRIFMCELALITHFYSLPRVLYKKTIYRQSLAERYRNDITGLTDGDSKRQSHYILGMADRLIRSRHIPLRRKLFIVPLYFPGFVWEHRDFVKEHSVPLFNFLIRVKRVLIWPYKFLRKTK